MKIKPSLQPGHVMLDLGTSDVQLLADGGKHPIRRESTGAVAGENFFAAFPGVAVAAIEDQNSVAAESNRRPNKTYLIEEVLSDHPGYAHYGINE